MRRTIEDTTLVVTGVLYQESQTSLLRDERGEAVTLMEVTDTKTGIKGHVYHEIASDKRDIEEERLTTDTPALFKDNHPEAYLFHELSCCGPHGTNTKRTDDITDLISNCEHELEYREGNPDGDSYEDKAWGLYCD